MEVGPWHRKRLRRQEGREDVRFITFSCHERLPLLGDREAADSFVAAMQRARHHEDMRRYELFAWVVMPDHVHMIVRLPPDVRWAAIASSIKISVGKRAIASLRRQRSPILPRLRMPDVSMRFWLDGGGFDRHVRDMPALCRDIQYVHQNPVVRGLVERPEDWKWSSVRWWMGSREEEVECDPPPGHADAWKGWKGFV